MSTAARVRTDPRISRRRRAIEKSRRRRLLITVASIALFAGAVWAVFWSPILKVREVVVVGATHVDSAEVASIAGLDDSDNLLLVSPGSIEDKVRQLPWVKRARVDRKLPGTVRVKIVERRPAMILSVGNERWTLDAFGNVLAEGASNAGLPVLAASSVTSPEPGARLEAAEIQAALEAWRSLSKKVRSRVAAVLAPTPERITLSLDDGTQVRYGAAEALDAKDEVLRVLLAQLHAEGESATYIDVRVPSSPALSPDAGLVRQGTATPVVTPAPSPST